MESGWKKNYLCTEILRTWYSGLQIQRRATDESPIRENSLPMQSGLTIKSAKAQCVWESGQCSWKAWPPLHVILHQHRQQQKEGSNWGPGPVSSTSYGVETIFLLGHIYLASQNHSDKCNKVFCLTGWHPPHLPLSFSSPYLQETQNQICVLNSMKQLGNILQQRNPDIKIDILGLLSYGGKMVTKQQNTF